MNGFANSLLTLLLGWMRVLFSALLTLPQRGSAFLAWLGRHWIPLVLVIVLAALFVDALIYILRWRPQYVWSTRLQRLFHRKEFLRDEGLDPDYIGIPIALETYMHRSWDNFEI